jgi:hypothetical protein
MIFWPTMVMNSDSPWHLTKMPPLSIGDVSSERGSFPHAFEWRLNFRQLKRARHETRDASAMRDRTDVFVDPFDVAEAAGLAWSDLEASGQGHREPRVAESDRSRLPVSRRLRRVGARVGRRRKRRPPHAMCRRRELAKEKRLAPHEASLLHLTPGITPSRRRARRSMRRS